MEAKAVEAKAVEAKAVEAKAAEPTAAEPKASGLATGSKLMLGAGVVALLAGAGFGVKLFLDNKAKSDKKSGAGVVGGGITTRKGTTAPVVVSPPPSGAMVAMTKGKSDPNAGFAFTLRDQNGGLPVLQNNALVFNGAGYAQFPSMTFDLKKGVTFVAKVQFNKKTPYQRVFEFGNAAPNFSQNIIFCVNDLNRIRWSIYETPDVEATCDLIEAATKYEVPQIYIGRLTYTGNIGVKLEIESRSMTAPTRTEYQQSFTRSSTANYDNLRSLNNNYLGRGNWTGDPLSNMALSNLYFYNSTLTAAQVESIVKYIVSSA